MSTAAQESTGGSVAACLGSPREGPGRGATRRARRWRRRGLWPTGTGARQEPRDALSHEDCLPRYHRSCDAQGIRLSAKDGARWVPAQIRALVRFSMPLVASFEATREAAPPPGRRFSGFFGPREPLIARAEWSPLTLVNGPESFSPGQRQTDVQRWREQHRCAESSLTCGRAPSTSRVS